VCDCVCVNAGRRQISSGVLVRERAVSMVASEMELRLQSPVGADPVVYKWPMIIGRGSVSAQ